MHNSQLFVGLDVSAGWIDAARQLGDGPPEHRRFGNDADGHAALTRWLTDAGATTGRPARVVMEASGVYSIDLALALHEATAVEVMVLNPRAAKDYRRAHMHRSTPPRWGGRPTRSMRPCCATTRSGCRSRRGARPTATPGSSASSPGGSPTSRSSG